MKFSWERVDHQMSKKDESKEDALMLGNEDCGEGILPGGREAVAEFVALSAMSPVSCPF